MPVDVAYFNTANLAPQLHAVRAAGEAALERRGEPWKISAADWFTDVERLRSLFASVIGASAEGVALVPATSRLSLDGIRHYRITGEPTRVLYAVTAHNVNHLPLAEPMLAAIRQTARERSL